MTLLPKKNNHNKFEKYPELTPENIENIFKYFLTAHLEH